jgi:titin
VTIDWTPPSAPGTFPLAGYEAVLMASFEERGGPIYTCEADPDVRSCTVPAMPGDYSYVAVVYAVDAEGNRSEPNGAEIGVVPAPDGVPASDGTLSAPPATTGGVEAGEQVTFSGSGYAPDSPVTLLVYSEPQVLGTVMTDADGAFTATVTLPEGLAAGRHTLVAAGLDPSGEMRYLTLPITVTAEAGAVGELAATGAEVAGPAIGGLAAVVLGSGLLVASRRRAAA